MTFDLPEPPSLNAMLDLAKRGKHGVMYRKQKNAYQKRATVLMRSQHPRPKEPWASWRIDAAHFRLWNPRDPLELMAGLKWAVDCLVESEYVVDDSPRELLYVASPTQSIERDNRGVTLTIQPEEGA